MKSNKFVYKDGNERWTLPNGYLHRTDGPAVIRPDGHQAWYLNGKLHRTDGPAIIRPDGRQEWYLNGNEYTEQQFNERLDRIKELEEILERITT